MVIGQFVAGHSARGGMAHFLDAQRRLLGVRRGGQWLGKLGERLLAELPLDAVAAIALELNQRPAVAAIESTDRIGKLRLPDNAVGVPQWIVDSRRPILFFKCSQDRLLIERRDREPLHDDLADPQLMPIAVPMGRRRIGRNFALARCGLNHGKVDARLVRLGAAVYFARQRRARRCQDETRAFAENDALARSECAGDFTVVVDFDRVLDQAARVEPAQIVVG